MASNDSTQIDPYSIQRRFWCRVQPDSSGCWFWTGGTRSNGYGTFAVKRPDGQWTQTTAHRFAYLDQVGPIPTGYEADHLCRVRRCVRPDHLEAVTVLENRRRRDAQEIFNVPRDNRPLPTIPPKPSPPAKRDWTRFCLNGHEYAIVGMVPNGKRRTCKACRDVRQAKRRKGNYASTRTHCPQGHPYSGKNLIWRNQRQKNGHPYRSRECHTCVLERNRRAYWRNKERRQQVA
jgi:hypothetical protein